MIIAKIKKDNDEITNNDIITDGEGQMKLH